MERIGVVLMLALAACGGRGLDLPFDFGADAAPANVCANPASPRGLPVAMASGAAVAGPDGLVYVFEGNEAVASSDTNVKPGVRAYAYDPVHATYAPLPDLPQPVQHLAGAAVAGRRVLVMSDSIYAYDIDTTTWTTEAGPPLFASGSYVVAQSPDGKIWIAFSRGSFDTVGGAAVYDPVAAAWASLPDLPTPLNDDEHGVFAGGSFYVLGLTAVAYDPAAGGWSMIPSSPRMHQLASAAAIDDRIYVAGGSTGADWLFPSAPTAALDIYDTHAASWTQSPSMLRAVNYTTSAVGCDGRLYVFGGNDATKGYPKVDVAAAVQAYDPTLSSWQIGTSF
jgi:Kelch motif